MKTTVSTKDYAAYLFGVVILIVYLFGADLFAAEWAIENKAFGLKVYQNYPNPIVNKSTIQIESEKVYSITIRVYNIRGRLVKTIEFSPASGLYKSSFTLGDATSGVYICQVIANGTWIGTMRMVVAK